MAASSALPQLPSLSSEQQALLLAALESNRRNRETNGLMSRSKPVIKSNSIGSTGHRSQSSQVNSPIQDTPASTKSGSHTYGDGLFGEFFESSPTFDVDLPTTNTDYFNDYTSYAQDDDSNGDGGDGTETGEKRKSPDDDDDDDDEDGDNNKRREGDDKIAKKPGRKLITTEPTTKRKAQNRAAQRAFRERKEKHLKDLEIKVADLEKITETKSTENTALRSQVERLQTELKEYKKRISTTTSTISTSPNNRSSPAFGSTGGLKGLLSDFQFDFSRFGDSSSDPALSAPMFGNTSLQSSMSANGAHISPELHTLTPPLDNAYGGQLTIEALNSQFNKGSTPLAFDSTLFSSMGTNDFGFGNLGNNTSNSSSSRHASQSNQSRSTSTADSPASSGGLVSASSAGTSPEPAPNYSVDGNKSLADLSYDSNSFLSSQYSTLGPPSQDLYNFSSVDWLSNQNGGNFDPQLFGEYRESQAAVIGDDAFNSGLFDDPYNFGDFTAATLDAATINFGLNNPSTTINPPTASNQLKTNNTTHAQVPPSQMPKPAASLMEQVDRCCNGETAQEPAGTTPPAAKDTDVGGPKYYMTTQKLWHELQSCPKFLSGDLDIDTLCSELSAKATCSETGMQVPKDVVEKVLWRLAGVPEPSNQAAAEQTKTSQWSTSSANVNSTC